MSIGATLPYNLRPKKAVDRNLFFDLLRLIERQPGINFLDYHYTGFGAAYLEEFKALHNLFGIKSMHCIEGDRSAHFRQLFNNPFSFIKYIPELSSDYIPSAEFVQDKPLIVWLDYTTPGYFRDQLTDLYNLGARLGNYDVVKFTFNAVLEKFQNKNYYHDNPNKTIRNKNPEALLEYFKEDDIYQRYLPENTSSEHFTDLTFPILERGMGIRALKFGLNEANEDLIFLPLSAFEYSDGQRMTTLTGICLRPDILGSFIETTQLDQWPFYVNHFNEEFIPADMIDIPVMTVLERMTLDKLLPQHDPDYIFETFGFHYGTSLEEHKNLLECYTRYYRYLPLFGKVII